jgi:hypothetical protein
VFELARLMGTSVAMIDRTYGHLARGHAERARERLNQRPSITGVDDAENVSALTFGRLMGADSTGRPHQPRMEPTQPCGLQGMELAGLEPATSWVRSRRSPS